MWKNQSCTEQKLRMLRFMPRFSSICCLFCTIYLYEAKLRQYLERKMKSHMWEKFRFPWFLLLQLHNKLQSLFSFHVLFFIFFYTLSSCNFKKKKKTLNQCIMCVKILCFSKQGVSKNKKKEKLRKETQRRSTVLLY